METTYRIVEGIGRITISAPPQNGFDHPVFTDPAKLREFFAEPELKGVVIMGGGNHFSSGADLENSTIDLTDERATFGAMSLGRELLEEITFAPVPVVAAIRGACLGGGLELALSCHFRIAAKSAMFGFPESGHGFTPGLGGPGFAREVIGVGGAVGLILSGEMIGAEEASRLGLVDLVVSPKEVEAEALAHLSRLTKNRTPRLVRSVMEAVHAGRRLGREDAIKRETEIFCALAREALLVRD